MLAVHEFTSRIELDAARRELNPYNTITQLPAVPEPISANTVSSRASLAAFAAKFVLSPSNGAKPSVPGPIFGRRKAREANLNSQQIVNAEQISNVARGKRSMLAASVIAVLMLFIGAPRAHGDDQFSKCQRDTQKAEAKLDKAVAEHGKHSHEAAERIEDLRKQRESCYEHIHQWWDGREQKWRHDDDFGKDLHNRDDRVPDSK
jgi:uncharacterized protein YndB with AHSA1/START domain/uncharacterized membrane-anchored protein YhcB (DUF1043 family)